MPRYRLRTYICKTLACRAHGTPPRHVWKTVHPTAMTTPPTGAGRTPTRSPQDQGRYPGQLPRPTPCPTVFDHCTPAIRGKYDDFHDPLRMYTVPPCVYKRRRWTSFKGVGGGGGARSDPLDRTQHSAPLSTRYCHSPQSTSPLAETWELPSLSHLACTPLLQAPPVQDNTVPSHTPCWTYGPGRNQDKPVRYYVASCINIWDEETRNITSWGPDRRVRTPTVGAPGTGSLRDVLSFVPI